jgi:hypothetical protein
MKIFKCLRGLLALSLLFVFGLGVTPSYGSEKPCYEYEITVCECPRFVPAAEYAFPSPCLGINDVDYMQHNRFLQYEKQLIK